MASTQYSINFSTAVSETTTKYYTDSCLPNLITARSTVPYTVNAALNVLLAIVAIFGNSLVFSAVRHSPSIRLASKLLLFSLILTDLGVGLVVQPQFVTFLVTKVKDSPAIACLSLKSFDFAAIMFYCASVSTMMAISLDRYIALFFHLKYHEIVTTRRVCVVLAIIWSFALFYPFTFLWNTALFASLNILFFNFLFLGHFCGLYQDIPRVTSSTWPSGSRPSTSPSSTTGRKHTGPGEVQKNSIQHAVDLQYFCTLLLAYVLYFLCHTIFSAECLYYARLRLLPDHYVL